MAVPYGVGFIYGGALPSGPGVRILQYDSARQMCAVDQTSRLATMSAAATAEQSYGLGWRRNQGSLSRSAPGMWGGHAEGEIDGKGSAWEASVVFGHGGATGATAFADPVSGVSCVLVTTDPALGESGLIRELSGMIFAAARDRGTVASVLRVRSASQSFLCSEVVLTDVRLGQDKLRQFQSEDNNRQAEGAAASKQTASL